MRLGLGTGSTASLLVELLAPRASELGIICAPTSEATRRLAARLGLPLTDLDATPELDLAIDGADEFDPQMRLIKGGGGALLHEKMVAASAKGGLIVIADASKRVAALGGFPLPVEVVPFGLASTTRRVAAAARALGLDGAIKTRMGADGHAFVTDGGHVILDCAFGRIDDPAALGAALSATPGVVEHGLFVGFARAIVIGGADGEAEIIGAPPAP